MADASPIAVAVEIPPEQIAAFHGLMNEIAAYTGRSLPSIVEQSTVYFLKSAGTGTKKGRKNRPWKDNPGKKPKYRFKVYHQGDPWEYIYTDVKMDPRRVIKRVGLAKNTWKALIGKANTRQSPKMIGGASAGFLARKVTRLTKTKSASNASITATNNLGYIPCIAPNVMPRALGKAKSNLESYLLRRLKSDMEKKWRS